MSQGMQVLIVDDDTAMRELLYDTLTRKGYEVMAVSSGQQALDTMKGLRPQLILLDSAMPGLSGAETAKRIRGFDDNVPIIFLKGAGEPELPSEELKRLGVTELLRKELSVELFVKGLDLCLRRLQQAPAAPAAAHAPIRVPGTLLVVDDEPKIQKLLQSFFESRGMKVIACSSGEEALTALPRKPLAVLLDMNMPGMDGLMTLKKIKSQLPKLPVIMASAVGEEGTIREALESGAYDYVTKPFNLEYLETVVLTKVLLGMEG